MECGSGFPAANHSNAGSADRVWEASPTIKSTPKIFKLTPMRKSKINSTFYEYPWGDKFNNERCSSKESKIGKTTRVTRYPNGRSAEGCYDMAGNVWEWTTNFYNEKRHRMVLRGGSWFEIQDDARVVLDRDDP